MQTCRYDSHTTWRPNTYLHCPGCCRAWPGLLCSGRLLARNSSWEPTKADASPPSPCSHPRILRWQMTEELGQGKRSVPLAHWTHTEAARQLIFLLKKCSGGFKRTYFQFLLRGETDGKVTPPSQSPVHSEELEKSHTRRCETDKQSRELLWETQKRSGSWKTLFSSGFQTSLNKPHCWSPSGVKWLILLNDVGHHRDPGFLFSVLKLERNRFHRYLLVGFVIQPFPHKYLCWQFKMTKWCCIYLGQDYPHSFIVFVFTPYLLWPQDILVCWSKDNIHVFPSPRGDAVLGESSRSWPGPRGYKKVK